MTFSVRQLIKTAIFLLILCILTAGCTSKTDAPPSPVTPVPTKYVVKGFTPFPTPSQVIVTDDGTKTCSQLKGIVAIPGQVCPGTYLTASDSFSCCSKNPVAGKTTNPRLTVEPLDLRNTYNDAFVEIGSGK